MACSKQRCNPSAHGEGQAPTQNDSGEDKAKDLGEEKREDVGPARAKSNPDTEFALATTHRISHYPIYADGSKEKSQSSEYGNDDGRRALPAIVWSANA